MSVGFGPLKRQSVRTIMLALVLPLSVSACSTAGDLIDKVSGKDDNVILPGKREAVLQSPGSQTQLATEPIVIPQATTNSSWAQPGGIPSNALYNLSLGRSLKRVFAVSAGTGSSKDSRLTASPIVVGGRIYVLDAKSSVRAFSANNGATAWAVSLVPKGKSTDGVFGGGLASDGASVYVTTGFGEVVALSTSGGAQLWRKQFTSPIKSAPTVSGGTIFFTTTSNDVYALSASNGSTLWRYQGAGETASAISNVSPAVSGGVVIAPQTSGDIIAFSAGSGQRLWSQSLASVTGVGQASNLNDISGRPVISGGQVFAIGSSGRLASFSLKSGEEIWSRDFAGNQTPWVSGEYIFVISQRRRMAAVTKKTGRVKWVVNLSSKGTWSGPVMGGGRLLVVSNKGALVSISPQTGKIIKSREAGSGYFIAPVIAGNTIYLLDDKANLLALR